MYRLGLAITVVSVQVTEADMQDPELMAEMQALMGGGAPGPKAAPKAETQQELNAQYKQYRQRAMALKQQGDIAGARSQVRT